MKIKLVDVLKEFQKEKKAIPAFTINNMETIQATMIASIETDQPIILMVSPSGIKYFGGIKNVYEMFVNLKNELKAEKTFLHLDHALDKQICLDAIDIGFDSIMFDGSKLSLDENIKLTKQIVDYGHKKDVLVEGEIGEVGGKEDDVEAEISLASPKNIKDFYLETNVDLLAASIGTVHGVYKKKPEIKFDILEELEGLQVPLVLHGSSGLPDDMIKKLIHLGEVKINVNTKNQQRLINGLKKDINTAKISDIRDLNKIMMKYYTESVKETVELFTNV